MRQADAPLKQGLQNRHGGPGESEDDGHTQDMYKAPADDRGRVTAQDHKVDRVAPRSPGGA